VCPM